MEQPIKISYNFGEGKERVKAALISSYLHLVESSSVDCERILTKLGEVIPEGEKPTLNLSRQVEVLVSCAEDLLQGSQFLVELAQLVDQAECVGDLLRTFRPGAVRDYIALPEIQNLIVAALLGVQLEEVVKGLETVNILQ